MYGDIGHGGLLAIAGLFLIATESNAYRRYRTIRAEFSIVCVDYYHMRDETPPLPLIKLYRIASLFNTNIGLLDNIIDCHFSFKAVCFNHCI